MSGRNDRAYDAGYDSGKNGANTENSHFGWFATPELRDAWQRGYDDATRHYSTEASDK